LCGWRFLHALLCGRVPTQRVPSLLVQVPRCWPVARVRPAAIIPCLAHLEQLALQDLLHEEMPPLQRGRPGPLRRRRGPPTLPLGFAGGLLLLVPRLPLSAGGGAAAVAAAAAGAGGCRARSPRRPSGCFDIAPRGQGRPPAAATCSGVGLAASSCARRVAWGGTAWRLDGLLRMRAPAPPRPPPPPPQHSLARVMHDARASGIQLCHLLPATAQSCLSVHAWT
jgi:hypothetical protein